MLKKEQEEAFLNYILFGKKPSVKKPKKASDKSVCQKCKNKLSPPLLGYFCIECGR